MYIGKYINKWNSRFLETKEEYECFICENVTNLIDVFGECPICSEKCEETFNERVAELEERK